MSAPEPNSVEYALLLLTARCDGARALDGMGFNAYDSPFGHALAERVDAGIALTGKQARAAYRMLRKYRAQLASAGIDYDKIPVPTDGVPSPEAAERIKAAGGDSIVITTTGGRIQVKSPFRLKEVVKQIPNRRWDPRNKVWTYPESPTQALTIRDMLATKGPMVTDDRFAQLVADAEGERAAQVHRERDDLPDVPIANLAAWNHQKQAFWFAKAQTACMLAMDMGTGKSRVTVDLLQNYESVVGGASTAGAQRVLIVCPAKVLGVWPREFRKHAHPDRPWHVVNGTYVVTRGMHKGERSVLGVAERVREFERALYDCRCGRAHAVVVNYEAIAHEPLKGWQPEGLDYAVFDEIHKIKAPNGVWSRWCHRIGKTATRRLGLTGTPMPQSPLDVYAQYRALDQAIFGTSFTSFKKRYAVMGGYGGYEILGLQNEAELAEKFHSIAYEVGAEVLDLPPETDLTVSCVLGNEARKVYNSLAGELWAQWDAGEITAANVLVKMLRLQQITGGAVGVDSGDVVEIDTAKADLLRDTLEDIGRVDKHDPDSDFEPVVVFCRFSHDLAVVKRETERLGRVYKEVSGGRSDGLTADATMDPDCDVIGVQIQAGGVGVDLTRACYAIYYSLGYSLGDYLQSRRRCARPGQTRPVRFIHLVCQDTQDEEVYEALEARAEVIDFVLHKAGRAPAPAEAAS